MPWPSPSPCAAAATAARRAPSATVSPARWWSMTNRCAAPCVAPAPHPRCPRGGAQEGRPAQGAQASAVLEALIIVKGAGGPACTLQPGIGGSSSGRTADSDSANLGSNPSPPAIFLSFSVIHVFHFCNTSRSVLFFFKISLHPPSFIRRVSPPSSLLSVINGLITEHQPQSGRLI